METTQIFNLEDDFGLCIQQHSPNKICISFVNCMIGTDSGAPEFNASSLLFVGKEGLLEMSKILKKLSDDMKTGEKKK